MGPKLSPEELLDYLGITTIEDIDLEAIAEYLNAHVEFAPLEGCEGRIVGNQKEAFITINSQARWERQRFSIGHEIGHWVRDRGKIVTGFHDNPKTLLGGWNNLDPEYRANRYASELLMPKFLFDPLSTNKDVTFETVKDLARKFKTSLTATALRLVELGSFPSMLVCIGDDKKRKWFKRNPIIPDEVWPLEYPGSSTVFNRLSSGKISLSQPETIAADEWIDHQNAKEYEVVEHTIRIPDYGYLSLIWWEDESQIVELI